MMTKPVGRAQLKLLSVVIPARDEEGCIAATVQQLADELVRENVPHEIVVVDDGSSDRTPKILAELSARVPTLAATRNLGRHGFGRAIIWGLDQMRGDGVVIMMADGSDAASDVVKFWRLLNEGWDCVFGSRFRRGGGVIGYPRFKLLLNRLANAFLQLLFGIRHNDITNAFKAYRRTTIDGCRPLISPHFNLTVELPLKAIVRGYQWTSIPNTYRNRQTGTPKLKIKEMGSRYLFICLYIWLEKHLSRGDYRRGDERQSRDTSTPGDESGIAEADSTIQMSEGGTL